MGMGHYSHFACTLWSARLRIELTAYALPRQAPRRRPVLNSLEESLARYGQRLRVRRNRWSTVDTSSDTLRSAEEDVNRRLPDAGHRSALTRDTAFPESGCGLTRPAWNRLLNTLRPIGPTATDWLRLSIGIGVGVTEGSGFDTAPPHLHAHDAIIMVRTITAASPTPRSMPTSAPTRVLPSWCAPVSSLPPKARS